MGTAHKFPDKPKERTSHLKPACPLYSLKQTWFVVFLDKSVKPHIVGTGLTQQFQIFFGNSSRPVHAYKNKILV